MLFFLFSIGKSKDKTMKLKMQFLIYYQSMDMSLGASCIFLLYQSEHAFALHFLMYLEKYEKV